MWRWVVRIICRVFMRTTKRTWRSSVWDPIEVIAGSVPRRQRRLVEAWAELHQEELIADWDRLQGGQAPFPIAPLE